MNWKLHSVVLLFPKCLKCGCLLSCLNWRSKTKWRKKQKNDTEIRIIFALVLIQIPSPQLYRYSNTNKFAINRSRKFHDTFHKKQSLHQNPKGRKNCIYLVSDSAVSFLWYGNPSHFQNDEKWYGFTCQKYDTDFGKILDWWVDQRNSEPSIH